MAYHDELADLKSYFDGRLKDDSIDLKYLVCGFILQKKTATVQNSPRPHGPRKCKELREVVSKIETERRPQAMQCNDIFCPLKNTIDPLHASS